MDLSIIIPNFNSGELLKNTLNSIFENTLYFKFEVIIIDNLSTDNPEEIVKSFPTEIITFISEKDNGIYDAMNKGIQKASGKWMYFLGSGDKIITESFNKCNFVEVDAKFIYGNVILSDLGKIYDGCFSLLKLLNKNISHQAILFKKDLFIIHGLYDIKYPIWSDYYFNLCVYFSMLDSVVYVDFPLAMFHGHGVSSIKKDIKFSEDKKKILFFLLLKNFSFSNFSTVVRYFFRNLIIKISSI